MAVCCSALRAARHARQPLRSAFVSFERLQACSLYTQTHTIRPPVESTAADILAPVRPISLRGPTAAVAGRLQQQESVPLQEGTPTTLDGALQSSHQARIITEARPPFRITHANGPWEKLCGYTADEVMHKAGLSFLQGAATDKKTVERINTAVREGGRIRVTVVNYTKDGTPFFNRLQISPLRSPLGQVTHMLGVLARASDP